MEAYLYNIYKNGELIAERASAGMVVKLTGCKRPATYIRNGGKVKGIYTLEVADERKKN